MGMYTRLVLNVSIKDGSPSVALIQKMTADNSDLEGRRGWMLRGSSYYHDNIQSLKFKQNDSPAIDPSWKLSVCCDLKNYEQEIQWFLDTIAPDVETSDLAGYVRYEEDTAPELIWFRDNKPVYFTPEIPATLT